MNDNNFNNGNNGYNPDEIRPTEPYSPNPSQPMYTRQYDEYAPKNEAPRQDIPQQNIPQQDSQPANPADRFSDFSKYNDYTQRNNAAEEPAYSPYSVREYSQYGQQSPQAEAQQFQNDLDLENPDDTKKKKKKKKKNGKSDKGFKAFVISLVSIISCIAILLAGLTIKDLLKEKNATNSAVDNPVGDSTQLQLNESPASSSTESVTAQTIAAKAKKFNVGILLYASSQQFMTSSSNSLVGEGSGIIMSEDTSGKYTYILTCAHVISDAASSKYDITVQDCDDNTYEATIVGYDEKTDIGVLRIEATGLTCAEFGTSDNLAIGQVVYAIGNPGGTEFFGSFTSGMISSIDRPISSESGYEMKCIQHTTPINSGNSGGALMNEAGQVIGINSSKIVSTGYEGMAFSIPISDAKPIIDDLIAHGYVTNRPKLGIKYVSASQYQQYALILKLKNLPAGSLVIAKITKDSSLANTDAEAGDLITEVDGEKLTSADVLLDKIESGNVGDKLELTLCRINSDYSIKEFKVTVTLVEDDGSSSSEDEEQTTQTYWEQYFGQGY